MLRKSLVFLICILVTASMLLNACGPQQATQAGPQTSGQSAPAAKTEFKSKNPATFKYITINGPDILDPGLDYETAGGEVINNVYENLVWYKKDSAIDFVPWLAQSYEISPDNLTYTFKLRSGIKFHDGGTLEPTDVAYSIQRAVIQGSSVTPALLLTEPLLGIGKQDITYLFDETGGMQDDVEAVNAKSAAELKAGCEKLSSTVIADDAAGTVTFKLAQPYAPFLATLAHTVASVLDKEWAIAKGAWDGSCETWQKFYAVSKESDPLAEIMNGTGPFKLESWDKPTQTVTMVRNPNYWMKEPMWEGAPVGPAKLERVQIVGIDEWGTRFAAAQAGDADGFYVPRSNVDQIDPMVGERADFNLATGQFGELKATSDPNQPFRLDFGAPGLLREDILMTEQVNIPSTGSPYTGSGQLNGNGIPSNFFADVHIRKAMNYCMDWTTFIKDYWRGEAIDLPYALSLPGELGFSTDLPDYNFDLKKCEEEFKAAELKTSDGRGVWDVGFFFVAVYNAGNVGRQTGLEILKTNLKQLNPKFRMEYLGLPWSSTLRQREAKMLPMFFIGWQEDLHDPHNWYSPYLTGDYGSKSGFSAEFKAAATDLVNRGVAETDPTKRSEIYKELNQKVYDYAPYILGPLSSGRHYEMRWVNGYYFNPLYGNLYYYVMSKN
jgi:peptide/nickel transport system substrate-binding protein